MPPKSPYTQRLMAYQPADELPDWKDRAIAASPWGGKANGIALPQTMPVINPNTVDPNHFTFIPPQGAQLRDLDPGYLPSWDASNAAYAPASGGLLSSPSPEDQDAMMQQYYRGLLSGYDGGGE